MAATIPIWQAVVGLLAAAAISLVSARIRLLSTSGAMAAFFVGTVVFALGGWRAALPLIVFYVSANAWGRWRRDRKAKIALEKGGPRDAWQVLANGGLPMLAVLAAFFQSSHGALWHLVYIAALAEGNADTWATEIGAASSERPRLITTMKPVAVGRSGAVSLTGMAAALAGAILVGISALPLFNAGHLAKEITIAAGAGLAGAVFDSLLGATVQFEPRDGSYDGIRWIGNDLVNFLSGLLACIAAALCFLAGLS